MNIPRSIFNRLRKDIDRPEISILLGPRQVGKTFLLTELENLAKSRGLRTRYYNLELPHDLMQFNKPEADLFDILTNGVDIVFIDEFHYLKNASKLFKAIYDSDRKVKIFVSGSSSLEMHKHLKESLAGRRIVTAIPPLSIVEFGKKHRDEGLGALLNEFLVFGGLPGLIRIENDDDKIELLSDIVETYIQKDIKSLVKEENIRAFNNLIYLLAENQGSVISVNGLSNEVGLTFRTVDKYLSILENTYVCHPVSSYAKNIGNELKKSRKIYFYDLGIRNALLKDFSPPKGRDDAGAIYESFIFLQLKNQLRPNMELRFWRNKLGHEIDFVILKNRKPFLIEVKTTINRTELPSAMKTFMRKYPETSGAVIFSENCETEIEYLGKRVQFLHYDKVYDLDIFADYM